MKESLSRFAALLRACFDASLAKTQMEQQKYIYKQFKYLTQLMKSKKYT